VKNQIDIAVSLRPQVVTRLNCHPIFEDELEFLVSPLHPWAQKAPKLKDTASETFIVASRNSLTSR